MARIVGVDIGCHVFYQAASIGPLCVDHALKGSRPSSYSSVLEAEGVGEKLALKPSFMAHSRSLGSVSSPRSPLAVEEEGFKLVGPSQLPTALAPCSLGRPTVDPILPILG